MIGNEIGPIPGPWFWRVGGKFCTVESETGADHGGSIGVCLLEHSRPEQVRRLHATAALIAAAPDLLKSLSTIVRFIELGGDIESLRRTFKKCQVAGEKNESMLGYANAAINRATTWGEP